MPPHLWWVLVGLTLAWGFNWTAMKLALTEISPFTFRSLCLGAGGGVLMGLLRASGESLAIPRGEWGRLVMLALANITGWNLLVAYGVALTDSGRAAIIAYSMPAWAIPLSVWLLGERMDARKLLGLLLGMSGIALLLWDDLANLHSAPLGTLLLMGAALNWAIGTILQKKYPVRAPVAAYTAWIMLIGGIPIFVGALILDDFSRLAEISMPAMLGVTYNVLVAFAFAHWAWIRLATSVSVTTFSLSTLMIPVLGVFSGMLFLGEQPGWAEFAAMALVTGSLLAVVIPRRRI